MKLILALLLGFSLLAGVPAPLVAQEAAPIDRSATGGAQTLEDIMARQRGDAVAPRTGDAAWAAQQLACQLGTLGGAS